MSSIAMSSPATFGAETQATARRGAGGSRGRMSWGAVIAGVVVALGAAVLIGLIGVAIGVSSLHPGAVGSGLGTGLWAILTTVLSMALGGYVAARLCGTHSHLDSELHGLTVWALTLLVGAVLLAQVISGAIAIAVQSAGSAAGGALSGGGALASGLTQQMSPQALIDRLQESLNTSGNPTQMTKEQVRNEIGILIGRRIYNGTLSDQDRDRLTTLVADEAGISKEEAARRINNTEQEAKAFQAQAQQRLQDAANAATHAATLGARALSAGLILGLATALIGAWFGTRHAQALGPAYSGDAPATVDYAYAAQHPTTVDHTYAGQHPTAVDYAYAGQQARPVQERVIVHGDARQRIVEQLQGLTFPASKRDLLSVAKARNLEPGLTSAFEHIADRPYHDVNDVLTALGMGSL